MRYPDLVRPLVLAGLAVMVAGCAAGTGSSDATATKSSVPTTACVLDAAALSAASGLTWTPNSAGATSTRCLYDPSPPGSTDVIGVDVAPLGPNASANELKNLPKVCDARTLKPIKAGTAAFVCRSQSGGVFSALVTTDRVVTVSAATVERGAMADKLASAFVAELTRLGTS